MLTQGKPQVQEERVSSRRLLPRGHGGRGRRSLPAQGPHPFQETSRMSEMIHERITEEQRGRVHKDRSLLALSVPMGSWGLDSNYTCSPASARRMGGRWANMYKLFLELGVKSVLIL